MSLALYPGCTIWSFSHVYDSTYLITFVYSLAAATWSAVAPRLTYTRKNEQLNQCCQQLVAMLCCTLPTTVVNNHCSQLFTFNNHCSIIVDNHQQAIFINYCQLMFQQHCNNYCSLSTSNNYWSNNTHQHCQFNKCCWTLITTLFRYCSANNVASTWCACTRQKINNLLQCWFQQDWTMFCYAHWSIFLTMLFSIVTPDSGQQYSWKVWTILAAKRCVQSCLTTGGKPYRWLYYNVISLSKFIRRLVLNLSLKVLWGGICEKNKERCLLIPSHNSIVEDFGTSLPLKFKIAF